jgi:hypothetical protein
VNFHRIAAGVAAGILLVACATAARPARPTAGSFDPNAVADVDVLALPVVPAFDDAVRANVRDAFARGRAAGLDPNVFSRLGDCMTENEHFLIPFGDGDFDLGAHTDLAPTIARFSQQPARTGQSWSKNSFGTPSLAAAGGFNVAAPLDATWADPNWCTAGESPFACELRVARPSIVVLMFGTNDVAATTPADFDFYLRSLVHDALDAGVVPLLSTFPMRPEDPEKTLLLNRIVVAVARDYRIPVMNLFRALESLPGRGVDPNDTIHLSVPPDGRTDVLDDAHLRFGFPVRNLVTLQALQATVAVLP